MGRDGPLGPERHHGARQDRSASDASAGIGAGGGGLVQDPSDVHAPPATGTGDAAASDGGRAEREAWAVLASVDGLGPSSLASLVRRCGSAGAVLERAMQGSAALRDMPDDPEPCASGRPRLGEDILARIVATASRSDDLLDDVARLGLSILTLEDEAYPPSLRATDLAPPVLFVLGDPAALREVPAVAVVGTRRPTEAGRRTAARIAGAVARAGATVVSGLALGIDGVAHEAALVEGGRTVAVLGAGHRHVTPAAHRGLATRIVEARGAIVSEYPPTATPTTWSFPRRNRVISGMSSATVVVEAGMRSGALITAAWALEQGRECFLVPGALDDEAARGSLRFLRDHSGLARVIAGVPELIEDLGLSSGASAEPPPLAPPIGDVGRRVAALVAAGHGTVDEIVTEADLPAASVLGVLSVLELQGLVVAGIGRYRPSGLLATRGLAPGGPTGRRRDGREGSPRRGRTRAPGP